MKSIMNMQSLKVIASLALLSAILGVLYGLGIHHSLIFDDARLIDGTVFNAYTELKLNVRMLSYGSFVWVRDLLGEGWWKQRIFNLGIHIGTVWMVYGLCRALLERTEFPDDIRNGAHFESSRRAALLVGSIAFAFNPVAVYAVAYLIQRSILMAAFFTAAACVSFVLGFTQRRKVWFGLALIAYVLAVMSKEHAVTGILLALPLSVFLVRPGRKTLAGVAIVIAVVLALLVGLLTTHYSDVLGTIYEDYGKAYARQLDTLHPGVAAMLFPLSIVNEMTLFFRYGLLWFFPNINWMAIDLQPAFPTSLWAWPHTAGALGYVALLLISSWLVLRRSDVLGLLGLCLLFPLLMFITEFGLVWIQDPFVLYRSYLWALAIPALVAIPLIGLSPSKILYPLAVLLTLLLGGLSFERLQSMQDAYAAWSDAASKVDLKAPVSAFGRWRPMLNLGLEQLRKGDESAAQQSMRNAVALGEPFGPAHTNLGVILLHHNQPEEALKQFDLAVGQGYATAGLYFQRGEVFSRLRKFDQAYENYAESLKHTAETAEAEETTRQRLAKSAAATGRHDEAIQRYQALIQKRPENDLYGIELSLTYLGQRKANEALAVLDPIIARRPSGLAYYARAVAYYTKGDRTASENDIQKALAAEPNNPMFKNVQSLIQTPAQPAR